MEEYEDLDYVKKDGIATVTLSRPERLNAMTPEMMDSMYRAFEDARRDDEVRVVVVTGAGRGFCSGIDVRTLRARLASSGNQATPVGFRSAAMALYNMDKPTIAMVNGVAVGGGCDLALLCDMRIASENARFSEIYIKLGTLPINGGLYLLPKLIGVARACELLFTGDAIDAQTAERIGLVNKVVPDAELEAATMDLAGKIAAGPPIAIRLSKKAIYDCLNLDFASSLDYASLAVAVAQATEDYREGVRAQAERRAPIFRGR